MTDIPPTVLDAVTAKQLRRHWESEIESLLKQRVDIDGRIRGLQLMLKGLDQIENPPTEDWKSEPLSLPPELAGLHSAKLTDAVRMIFNESTALLTPRQVRDRLALFNYRLPVHNAMAAVHGVIRRLADAGEIKAETNDKGKKAFRAFTAVERLLGPTFKAFGTGTNPGGKSDDPASKLRAPFKRGDIAKAMMKGFGGPPFSDVPHPGGKTLAEMVKETRKK